MNLFDKTERVDTGPASHSEDSYSYYNRSARIGVIRIRELLQSWFDHYPIADQPELAARFRADFDSAFFELFLHELLLRLGTNPVPHPTVSPTNTARPDFQLSEQTSVAYLEARVARDESRADSMRRSVLATIYDQINKLPIPDYFLRIVDLTRLSDKQPSVRRLGRELLQWVNTLDYFALLERRDKLESLDELPTWHYEDDAIRVEISVSPVSEPHRGAPGHRPIGIYPFESRWGGSEVSLRRALERKGAKYGDLGVPYIVAVNSLSTFAFERIDQMEALFGKEEFVVGPDDTEPVMIRKPNGFWQGPRGPQHTRVSAVLFCQIGTWNVHAAAVCLYHNPMAKYPYQGKLLALPQATPTGSKMVWSDGVDFGAVFNLPPDWLGE